MKNILLIYFTVVGFCNTQAQHTLELKADILAVFESAVELSGEYLLAPRWGIEAGVGYQEYKYLDDSYTSSVKSKFMNTYIGGRYYFKPKLGNDRFFVGVLANYYVFIDRKVNGQQVEKPDNTILPGIEPGYKWLGGAGFIGSYVTKLFLEGNYKVKVSSTDITNKSKYEHLHSLQNAENLEVCACDVRDTAALEAFVKDCDIIIHTGTPFMLDVKDPQTELFDPTVKGTENFLQIIQQAEGLKKVVFVASVAAWNTSFPMNPATAASDHVFTEAENRLE